MGAVPISRPFPDDPHSNARPNQIAITHLELDLEVDFDERRLTGSATYELEHRTAQATELVLDTWQLEIAAVTLGDGTPAPYQLGDHDPVLGRALTIDVGTAVSVTVRYNTHPDATALQWLEPAQTASGKRFLFSQSEPIMARSWIPAQDTPSVRITYDATVRVPADLLALMSAENPTERTADGVYRFSMAQPVPVYLVALAVGDLEFRALGDRTGVYAEPSVVEAAAWEFADTESMMAAAERLWGPYRWDRFDLLVLPPSFPYGGMENPRLTFVTPTLLAGDRSLVSIVAHELAHSWSGNLVTNATWNDIWLNEGFTVYCETRIDEELYGASWAAMVLKLYRQDLLTEIPTIEPRDTWLAMDLAGRDPELGMTPIAYDMGSLFLRALEQAVGRTAFDAFLKAYFDRFAFESMDTPTFLAYLRTELLDPHGLTGDDLLIDAWVHGPGLPDNAPDFTSDAFDLVGQQAAELVAGRALNDLDTSDWSTHQWVHFIRALPRDLDASRLADTEQAFALNRSSNIEIGEAWLQLVIDSGYVFESPAADEALVSFVTRHGRVNYLKPLFKKLAGTPEGLARAREIYAAARPGYHSVTTTAIDRILDWS